MVLICYQMEMLDYSIIMQTRKIKSINTSILLLGKKKADDEDIVDDMSIIIISQRN